MNKIKDELQRIIFGNGPDGQTSQLKKIQRFLNSNAETSLTAEKQQQFKSEETAKLLAFAEQEGLLYAPAIHANDFISEGAEQKVYRMDGTRVLKTNAGVFYECWRDYFNSLLVHNYFFPATAYTFLGFKVINGELNAVVMQEFIVTTESTDLTAVKQFLEFNHFQNNRNNDYISAELGLIFEDLHDENVLSRDGILFFIDTVFYLTPNFYI
jgi:Serine/Threonine/Tyrosine Kinase found in polyvalent proteins